MWMNEPGAGIRPCSLRLAGAYTDIVKVLLEAGADVHAVGDSKRKAKGLAYERGYTETAHLIETYEKGQP